eukprot:TRINITY_DN5539_c0_g2_i1.p1 TRINITY_DN5539_c0_g2~~TRINITY_DN5539_c0_g2_i1.p1  ORF type:complete len:647 (-),score=70.47 TRINITY_DN5539_c0_g2_i1:186-2126(-)
MRINPRLLGPAAAAHAATVEAAAIAAGKPGAVVTYSNKPSDQARPAEERELLKQLTKFKCFQDLSAEAQRHLANICKQVCVGAGATLFRQGDPPGNCYVLLEGEVGIFVKSEDDMVHGDSRQGTPREGAGHAQHGRNCRLSFLEGFEDNDEQLQNGNGGGGRRGSVVSDSDCTVSGGNRRGSCISERRGSMFSEAESTCGGLGGGRRRRSSVMSFDGDGADPSGRRGSIPCLGPPANMPLRDRSRVSIMTPEEQAELRLRLVRLRTLEGFSFYHEKSFLGVQVATKGAGDMFGELALMQDQPRSATVRASLDSEFLVISRTDFDNVLKAEMNRKKAEKLQFLKEHIPGMRYVPKPRHGRADASYFWRKASYPRGHQFLKQGTCAEDIVCVVSRGSCEVIRQEGASCDPGCSSRASPHSVSSKTSSRPSSANGDNSASKSLWQKSGSPGNVTSSISAALQKKVSGNKICWTTAPRPDSEPRELRMGVVVTGGVFGSLPTPATEPFTVRALSPTCEVYFVTKHEMNKLPRLLVDDIHEYLVRTTTWRLKCLRDTRFKEAMERGRSAQPPKEAASNSPLDVLTWETTLVGKLLGFRPKSNERSSSTGCILPPGSPPSCCVLAPTPSPKRISTMPPRALSDSQLRRVVPK